MGVGTAFESPRLGSSNAIAAQALGRAVPGMRCDLQWRSPKVGTVHAAESCRSNCSLRVVIAGQPTSPRIALDSRIKHWVPAGAWYLFEPSQPTAGAKPR